MKGLIQLLRATLPDIVSGLAVAAILAIIGLLYTFLGLSAITLLVAGVFVVTSIAWFLLSRQRKRVAAKVNVLFADNDPDFVEQRKQLLEIEGFHVLTAHTTNEARRMLDQGNIDIAILDVRLVDDDDEHDVSGLALAKSPLYRNIPKIILTNFPSTSILHEALDLVSTESKPTVLDFVSKAEGAEAVVLSVKRALSLSDK